MTQINTTVSELKKLFRQYIWDPSIKIFKVISKKNNEFNERYPTTYQNIQLTFVYLFAFIDLCHGILNPILALGGEPVGLEFLKPAFVFILTNSVIQALASPERIWLMSYVVIEWIIIRKTGFSKLVKYNVILIFSMLMVQGITISYWDTLFHRSISDKVEYWLRVDGSEGGLLHTDRQIAIAFFVLTFFLFLYFYIDLYWKAIQREYGTLPGYFSVISDSAAFWLRIRTPNMKKRRDTDENFNEPDPGEPG